MCLQQTENCLRGYGVGVERRTDKPNDFMYRIGGMHRTIRSCKQFKASVPSLNTYLLFALAIRDFSLENLFESQNLLNYSVSYENIQLIWINHYVNQRTDFYQNNAHFIYPM